MVYKYSSNRAFQTKSFKELLASFFVEAFLGALALYRRVREDRNGNGFNRRARGANSFLNKRSSLLDARSRRSPTGSAYSDNAPKDQKMKAQKNSNRSRGWFTKYSSNRGFSN